GKLAAETLGVPLLGEIPLMPELREGGDAGTPIVVSHPDSAAGRALLDTASALASVSRTRVRKPLKIMATQGAAAGNGHAGNGHEGHDHAHEQHEHAHHQH